MVQLLRQSLRSLAKRPGLSVFVILIIALCIGGTATIFSAAYAVLFRAMPFNAPDRLVFLTGYYLTSSNDSDVSWVEMADWRTRSQSFESVAPFHGWQDRLLVQGDSVERVGVCYAHPDYFHMFGVKPRLGRLFTEEENGAPGTAPAALLSHDAWRRLFAGDPKIVGREIRLNSKVYTVVGVMPETFHNPLQWHNGRRHDIWLPAIMAGDSYRADTPVFEDRNHRIWLAVARLKPGVTFEQARQEVEAIAARLQSEFPDSNQEYTARVYPLRSRMFGHLYAGMKVLLAGAVLVLLIGCANVANLLVLRLMERRKELSLRLSLGASRRQIVQQVLIESTVLALAGGVLGVLLSIWGIKLLAAMMELPPFTVIELDGRVLAVSVATTLLTAAFFAVPLAVGIGRMESSGALRQIQGAGKGLQVSRGQTGLLVFQISVVVVLLVVAGLFLRSFWLLRSTELGLDTKDVLTLRMSFDVERGDDEPSTQQVLAAALQRLDGAPGVEAAAVWISSTPGLIPLFTDILPDGATSEEATLQADLHRISAGALRLLGVPILQGRDFTAHDTPDKPRVAIVSQNLAGLMWPGKDPIGQQLYRPGRENDARMTVVGVIPDTRLEGRFQEGHHDLMVPYEQSASAAPPLLMIRTNSAQAAIVPEVRKLLREVDPRIPVYDIASLDDLLRHEERSFRLNAAVVSLYSVLVLALSLLGLYGLLAYSVVQRTPEIGVRLALGADRRRVLRMVMARGLLLSAAGFVLGMVGALAITRFVSSVLFGIEERDPLTFLVATGFFVAVVLLAVYLPARRTLQVEPTVALRYD
jgi:predicted permease